MKKDFIDLSPSELNRRLIDKWNISLFKFARVFAHGAGDWARDIEKHTITRRRALSVSKSLSALRKHILKTMQSLWFSLDMDISEDKIIEGCELRPFFDYLSSIDRTFGGPDYKFPAKKGARLKKRNHIVTSWGILIKKAGVALTGIYWQTFMIGSG